MKKAYIIFPLIGLLIFVGFYLNFDRNYTAQQVAIKAKADQDKKDKAAKQVLDREQAMKEAVESAKKREAERKIKEAADEAKKTARLEAEDRRERSYSDRNKFREQVSRLKKELDEVKDSLTKVTEDKKHNIDELAFLKTYVKQAEANVKYYYDLLDKITAAEKARIEAAAAAATKKS